MDKYLTYPGGHKTRARLGMDRWILVQCMAEMSKWTGRSFALCAEPTRNTLEELQAVSGKITVVNHNFLRTAPLDMSFVFLPGLWVKHFFYEAVQERCTTAGMGVTVLAGDMKSIHCGLAVSEINEWGKVVLIEQFTDHDVRYTMSDDAAFFMSDQFPDSIQVTCSRLTEVT